MKRFKFKFASVLKIRKMQEDQALRNLALAQKAYQSAIERKNQLLSALDRSMIRLASLGAQATSIVEFQSENDFIVGTRQRIIQAEQAIHRAAKEVEKMMRNYLFAKRKTRMIETLQEKAVQDYKKQLNKHEQKELDDLVIMRHRLKEDIS